jgi:DDE superfamily endonuclease
MVDGTLIVFKEKPVLDRVESMSYFNYRKQKYGFQAKVVCDDEARILKFNCSYPGAVHDARAVFRNLEGRIDFDELFDDWSRLDPNLRNRSKLQFECKLSNRSRPHLDLRAYLNNLIK